ncbi:MAG: Smr/MutS family protein [Bacteroides sp.]|nr:Smr/MutS family protein [Bacteroides sp.]MCM1379229.1 Smr/MutS family protein [Bacteroides sp.]MCM1445113.1 Smr/MutS family protein [Prevotella sp.]
MNSVFEQKIGFGSVRREIAAQCLTESGREFADREISFQTDFHAIRAALEATAEMVAIVGSDADNLPLGRVADIRRSLMAVRIEGTFLPADELAGVRNSLDAFGGIAAFFDKAGEQYPRLATVTSAIGVFPDLVRAIDRVIDRYGNVLDSASSELADIRRSLAHAQGSIAATMRRVMAAAVAQGLVEPDATPAVRDGRMVIPVSPMHKRKVNGIVHDESASGKTVFIEPAEVVQTNNRLRELQMEERREIARIMMTLTAEIRPHIPAILDSLLIAAELDFIHAKALYARVIDARLPHISAEPELEWYHACHPGLMASLKAQGKEIVPLDIHLSRERRLLIVSGPNAGGKSVTLKTVGVVQYMMQCGILPPVFENSHMGVFESIFIDIGDDQSIENDLSTYSSHLTHMKHFMAHGDERTLALIDEFGTGTEPLIGGAIAQAILARFAELGLWGVITTHYQNLKQFAEETPGLVNGSMLYDRQKMEPMFKLVVGTAGSSFAIEIARKIGLPEDIVNAAKEIVGTDYVNMDKYLLDIARDRRYWENKRMAIRQKEKKIEEVLNNYQSQADDLRAHRREILADAKEQARQIIEGSNAAIERTIHEIRKSQADRDTTKQLRSDLRSEQEKIQKSDSDHPLLKKAPKEKKNKQPKPAAAERPIAVGDYVKLDGQETPGEVLSIEGKNATVSFGMLRTTVKLNRLHHTLQKPQNIAPTQAALISGEQHHARRLDFKQEIDVRGMRADEALQTVMYFIDDAIRFSAHRVRILHGTGTGALRQAIRQYLSTVSAVSDYRDEDVRLGGAGITVVTL